MPHFNLVRYRNGDFVLSAGSRIPVDTTAMGKAIPDFGVPNNPSIIADLVLNAGNGMSVDVS